MAQSTISDEAVVKATGKNWKEWFAILDKAGARKMKHIDIAEFLNNKYLGKDGVNITSGGWWSQMVTVQYERARGMRSVNQTTQGFIVAVHKTVPYSMTQLRKKWEEILKSKEVAKKKLIPLPSNTKRPMLFYTADIGRVVVSFDERGPGKSRIMVESTRLPKESLVEQNRTFWKKILENL